MEMTEALVKDEEDLIAQVLKVKKNVELMFHPANPRPRLLWRAAREGLRSFPFFKVSSVLDSCRILFWPSGCRSVIIYICESEFFYFYVSKCAYPANISFSLVKCHVGVLIDLKTLLCL